MKRLLSADLLAKHLANQGLVPPNCRSVELVSTINSGLILRYECLLEVEDLGKFAEALLALSADVGKPPQLGSV
jgi:hypothetical protein